MAASSWRFPPAFWTANVIELCERAAYYGWFIMLAPFLTDVVGYSDIPTADLVTPPLTTVAVDHYHMGAEAAKILLSVVDADSPTVPRSVRFPVSLVGRGSVAPMRVRRARRAPVTSPEQAGQGSPVPSGPAGTSG